MSTLTKTLKSRKGFTLMEVIVVLIILAVLAAALIPTFLGFINQAASATAIADARLGLTAAQAVVTESVGRNVAVPTNITDDPTFIQIVNSDIGTDANLRFGNVSRNDYNRVDTIQYTSGGTNPWFVRIDHINGTQTQQGGTDNITHWGLPRSPDPTPPTDPPTDP
ncbi:MAG: prepilin-type N-terminal cleavage/methylation domain-containing protein [Oscillospiraceae bacterium]|nr:prepilin-type N-terminal cleavage/methylation domain-containing protein [Oscillospiraceae bacterium]